MWEERIEGEDEDSELQTPRMLTGVGAENSEHLPVEK